MGETTLELSEEFYVGMAATSVNNESLRLARFKNVDLHSWGSPIQEGIVSHTFPDTIPASGVIDFEVEYETLQTLDVWADLQNVQTLKKYQVLRKRLQKKSVIQLTYNAGKKLDHKSSYWFVNQQPRSKPTRHLVEEHFIIRSKLRRIKPTMWD